MLPLPSVGDNVDIFVGSRKGPLGEFGPSTKKFLGGACKKGCPALWIEGTNTGPAVVPVNLGLS